MITFPAFLSQIFMCKSPLVIQKRMQFQSATGVAENPIVKFDKKCETPYILKCGRPPERRKTGGKAGDWCGCKENSGQDPEDP
jgi:hypothetical protein